MQAEHDKEVFGKMFAKDGPAPEPVGLTAAELQAAEARDKEAAERAKGAVGNRWSKPSTPEQRMKEAVEFLRQPKVATAKREQKILYLQSKCQMTAAEVDAAFKQAAAGEEPGAAAARPGSPTIAAA